jgi:hypothetical protein
LREGVFHSRGEADIGNRDCRHRRPTETVTVTVTGERRGLLGV